MHRLVEPPGAGLERQRLEQPAAELTLAVEREIAVEAGVVDDVLALGDLGDQGPDALAQALEHGPQLGRRHPGLEVVEERVVGVLGGSKHST